MQAGSECRLLGAQRIRIGVGIELGHPHLLGRRRLYLGFDL